MRFKIDYNPKNEQWEVKDNLCCDQVVGSHFDLNNAQAQLEYEETLWHKFDSETQEINVEHWCLFYSLNQNIELNTSRIGTVSASMYYPYLLGA